MLSVTALQTTNTANTLQQQRQHSTTDSTLQQHTMSQLTTGCDKKTPLELPRGVYNAINQISSRFPGHLTKFQQIFTSLLLPVYYTASSIQAVYKLLLMQYVMVSSD